MALLPKDSRCWEHHQLWAVWEGFTPLIRPIIVPALARLSSPAARFTGAMRWMICGCGISPRSCRPCTVTHAWRRTTPCQVFRNSCAMSCRPCSASLLVTSARQRALPGALRLMHSTIDDMLIDLIRAKAAKKRGHNGVSHDTSQHVWVRLTRVLVHGCQLLWCHFLGVNRGKFILMRILDLLEPSNKFLCQRGLLLLIQLRIGGFGVLISKLAARHRFLPPYRRMAQEVHPGLSTLLQAHKTSRVGNKLTSFWVAHEMPKRHQEGSVSSSVAVWPSAWV